MNKALALHKSLAVIDRIAMQAELFRLDALSLFRSRKAVRLVNTSACAFLGFFGVFFILANAANAFTAPAASSFAYTIYTIGVTNILKGPIGFVAGVSAIVLGAIMAIQQKVMMAIPCILGGAALMSADTLLTSMGMTF